MGTGMGRQQGVASAIGADSAGGVGGAGGQGTGAGVGGQGSGDVALASGSGSAGASPVISDTTSQSQLSH